jgi:hypothetical protein
MHAIIDTERKTRNKRTDQVKATQHRGLTGVANEMRDAHLIGSVTDLKKQHGAAMTATAFTDRVRKLNHDLVCKPHPSQPGFCNMYLALPDGSHMHLMPMEDWMPEWSVMETRDVRTPTDGFTSYWIEAKTLGMESKRGWRTVLARLVQQHLVPLDAVEREFGAGNRRSWAALVGKTADAPLL